MMPVPRITSRSPLNLSAATAHGRFLSLPKPEIDFLSQPLPSPTTVKLFTRSNTLRRRRRWGWIGLLSLLACATYVFFYRTSFESSTREVISMHFPQNPHTIPDAAPVPSHSHSNTITLSLSPQEELAALTSFLSSIHGQENSLPYLDPSKPIDPELMLDFDVSIPLVNGEVREKRVKESVSQMEEETWKSNPVVVYGKPNTPALREIRSLFAALHLAPAPTYIELTPARFADSDDGTRILGRLTGATELPVVLIGGKYTGTYSDIKAKHKDGLLEKMLNDAGSIVGGDWDLKKKKRH